MDFQPVGFYADVVCHNPQCPVAEQTFRVIVYSNADAVFRVFCGQADCRDTEGRNRPVTDITIIGPVEVV